MKKIKISLALCLILFTLLNLFGCAIKIPEPEEVSSADEAQAIGLSLGDYDGNFEVGEYGWLDINIKIDYRHALKWSSSNPEVATVDDNGRVDAIAPGTATITARVEKSSVSYDITVKKAKASVVTSTNANVNNSNKLMVEQNKANGKKLNLYSLHVNAKTGCITAYTYNSSEYYYLPVRSMVCSVAKDSSVYESENPLETIFYQVGAKEEWQKEDDGKYYRYNTVIKHEGTEFKFSSCAYEKESSSTLITEDYNKLGTAFTGGEIRLAAEDAKWIYDNCDEGTQIRIVGEGAKDELKRPNPIRISENAKYKNWDPTDPDKKNPYLKIAPTFTGIEELHISKGSGCDLYKDVDVFDTCMNPCGTAYKVDSKVLTEKAGKYIATYYYTDSLGHYGRADRTIIVE